MSLDDNLRRARHRRRMREIQSKQISRAGPVGDPNFWMSSRLLNLMNGGMDDPFKESPWVHRAIITIIDSLKSVEFQLYTGEEEDKKPVERGPWYEFMLSPSTQLTRREFWGLTWNYTQIGAGDAFWILFGRTDLIDEREIPVEAQVIAGDNFEAKTKNGRMDHWLFTPKGGGTSTRLELYQVIQFAPIRDPNNPNRAVSPMTAALRDIRTDDKAARWNEALLTNGARPDGILVSDQNVTLDQAKAIKAGWNDMHKGADKAGKIGVLGDGFKWQDVTLNHTEMGFQANREWARQVVGTAFGVPMMFLNVLDDVHKETSRTVTKQLWTTNLIPKLTLAEDLLESRLFQGRGSGVDAAVWGAFDLTPIEALSDSADVRRDNATKDRAMGFSLNEINRRHDLDYEDQGESGDVGLVPFNLQTVDAAAATFDEIDEPTPAPVADEPPSPPSDNAPVIGNEEEAEGRAVSERRSAKREAMWQGYIRAVQAPGEKKMKKRYLGWARGRIADTLRWLAKADDGRSVRKIKDSQIDAFVASQHARWHDMLAKQTKPVDTSIISDTLDRTGDQIGGLTAIDMSDPRITELIAERGAEKVKIVDTMLKKRIRNTLVEGSANGESIAQLQERVRAVGKVQASQAQTIARTESASASSQAKEEVMDAEGIVKIRWLTAGDEAVRDSHAAIDDDVVNRGEEFSNGLKYPHDPDAPAEEVINCRCEAIPEV